MVGLCDQFLQIRDMVITKRRPRYARARIIWISGMAGVGKTVLAKKVFHDPLVKTFFQSRAYIRVGIKFGYIERIRQAINDQLNLDRVGLEFESMERICQSINDHLNLDNGGMSQKSLLLLDDVWDDGLVYDLFHKTWFKEGVLVLVTSRTDSHFDGMKMRFMIEEESWELLRRKVFGDEEEYCPPQLAKAGKKIAEKCEGLPLLINAVAPILLSKAQKDPERWNRVAHKPDSILEEASHQISQLLFKSHYPIREDDKLCFLYIASFPLSCVVPLSTITNLWLAEGFILHSSVCDVLIGKNLVINHQKSWSEAEAFSLHCSYWYVSKRVAMNNKFLYVIKSCADDLDESIKSHRRLAIQENVLLAIKEVYNKIGIHLICSVPSCSNELIIVTMLLIGSFDSFPSYGTAL